MYRFREGRCEGSILKPTSASGTSSASCVLACFLQREEVFAERLLMHQSGFGVFFASFLTVCPSGFGPGWSLPRRLCLHLVRKPPCPNLSTHSALLLQAHGSKTPWTKSQIMCGCHDDADSLRFKMTCFLLVLGPVGLLPLWRRQFKEKLFVSPVVCQDLFTLDHFTTTIDLNLD